MMKEIYIVVSYTGTTLSHIIRFFTRDEFSHVSIALDPDLNKMYSFGRLNPYNPFWGGFVHEYRDKGTFKRFYKTRAGIYSYTVTEKQYEKMVNCIGRIEKDKNHYRFNTIGLFAVGIHRKIKRSKSFYCAEFVKYVLEDAQIELDLPEIIRPEDFKNIKGAEKIYCGLLQGYQYENEALAIYSSALNLPNVI